MSRPGGWSHLRTWTSDEVVEWFLAQIEVDPDTLCWMWTGPLGRRGHGRVDLTRSKQDAAHRYAYRQWRGEIPARLHIVRRCDRRLCVNPDHMTLAGPAAHKVKTCIVVDSVPERLDARLAEYDRSPLVCKWGHWVIGDNALALHQHGEVIRKCKACRAEQHARWAEPIEEEDPREAWKARIRAARGIGRAS